MNIFDVADFQANPLKYREFRTARIATDQLPDFKQGEIVSVQFQCLCPEMAIHKGKMIPVYLVAGSGGRDSALFANALCNFVL